MNVRSLLAISGLTVTALMFSGCSGSSDTPTSTASNTSPSASSPAAGSHSGRAMGAPSDFSGGKAGETTGEPESVSSDSAYGGGSTGGASFGEEPEMESQSGGPSSHSGPSMASMGAPSGGGPSSHSGPSMASMGPPAGGGGPSSHSGPSMAAMGAPSGGGPSSHSGPSSGGPNPSDMRSMASGAGKGGMMAAGGSFDGESNFSGEGSGFGGTPGGIGLSSSGTMSMNGVVQFVNMNCVSCHGAANPKGGVRLVGAGSVEAEPLLWQGVLEQLENGSMPPPNGRRPDAAQQQAVIAFLTEQLKSAGLDTTQDYLAQAKFFFGSGKEQDAIEYFYAKALTADEAEAQELISNAQFFAAGKRPVTMLRFAVGVVLEAPEGIDVKPIGSPQFGNGAGGGSPGRGGGEFGGLPGGVGGANNRQQSFYDLTGDFGRQMVSAFESRWSAGAMGTVFSDVASSSPSTLDTPQNGMDGEGMGMGRGEGGLSPAGMAPGGMGRGPGGMEPGGMGMGFGGGNNAAPAQGMANQPLKPGLFYLGTGSQVDLLKKANEEGFDGLFVYDVEASVNRRTGTVSNSTRLRLILADGSAVTSTATLVNTEVEREKQRGTSDDKVKQNIDRLFAKFDESLKLTPMPKLSAESARRRVQQLINDPKISKLQTLFEARMYNSLGSLSVDDLSLIYQIVLRGNEGISLATGAVDDRKLVVDELVQQL